MNRIPLFIGADTRDQIGMHVFISSVMRRCSLPLAITPLYLPNLDSVYQEPDRKGTTAFHMSRFLVPYLMRYKGHALYMDGSDMLCRGDLAELWELRDSQYAVQCAQPIYASQFDRKFLGTAWESPNVPYPRKNWSSVMLFNCEHSPWRAVENGIPGGIPHIDPMHFHRFRLLEDAEIGSLDLRWNWLVGEFDYSPHAKIAHFTLGSPAFNEYQNCDYADEWYAELEHLNEGLQTMLPFTRRKM